MKIRQDFVTNSSSSSFIIRTKGPLPEIKGYVERLTKENFKAAFEAVTDFFGGCISYNLDNEELQEILNINDEQLFLLMVAKENKMDEYLKLKEYLEEDNIYFIDYEPYSDEYYEKYIKDNVVLMSGGI